MKESLSEGNRIFFSTFVFFSSHLLPALKPKSYSTRGLCTSGDAQAHTIGMILSPVIFTPLLAKRPSHPTVGKGDCSTS